MMYLRKSVFQGFNFHSNIFWFGSWFFHFECLANYILCVLACGAYHHQVCVVLNESFIQTRTYEINSRHFELFALIHFS